MYTRIYLFLIVLSLLGIAPAWAESNNHQDACLNKVTFQLNAEQWVTTKTALVTIGVNVGISDSGVEKIQEAVLAKLNKISDQGTWHIVSLNRSQDQSGLEKIQISAQARLASSVLSGLRDKAKAISKPGETFTIDDIQVTPNEDEWRAAHTDLRNNIYQQAKDELDRLNKVYPNQKYFIHDINFLPSMTTPMPVAQANFISVRMPQGSVARELSVGDKLVLTATVTLASVPDQLLAKIAPH